jgi:hypothetical protein
MQITVACHNCDKPKRPLAPCPSCSAPALAEPELQAWRVSLHARHLARIKQEPVAVAVEPPSRARTLAPMRAVVVLDIEPVTARAGESSEPATIIPLEPALPADQALSFDWDDEPRRLRKSA